MGAMKELDILAREGLTTREEFQERGIAPERAQAFEDILRCRLESEKAGWKLPSSVRGMEGDLDNPGCNRCGVNDREPDSVLCAWCPSGDTEVADGVLLAEMNYMLLGLNKIERLNPVQTAALQGDLREFLQREVKLLERGLGIV